MKLGEYIKFIDDGTLAKNIALLTQMAERCVINNYALHKIAEIMLNKYWDKAIRR